MLQKFKRLLSQNQEQLLWITLTVVVTVLTKSVAVGLTCGLLLACLYGNRVKKFTGTMSKKILQLSVILLGFKMSFYSVLKVGGNSVWITMISISLVLSVGYLLGRFFSIERKLSTLISGGTAICGGSAIAAIAPAIQANSAQIAVSMAVVFTLNAIALFIFPPIGRFFEMTQDQFGLWAAIAIHDTSSVVGAVSEYGSRAAALGTTVKLTRALWILPVAFLFSRIYKSKSKASFPMFLLGFIAASILRSIFPQAVEFWDTLASLGKRLMVATLFLVGAALSPADIRKIGLKPLLCAIILWIVISVFSFTIIKMGWLSVSLG